MKIKKKLFVLLAFVSFSFNYQKGLDNISFKYLDFEKTGNSSSLNFLFLEIQNNSSDTIYLSRKNIIINVLKNKTELHDEINKSIGQLFYKPTKKNKAKITRENIQEKQTARLRHNFAKKIFYKNFSKDKSKQNKDFIIQTIENDCIVILPKQTINYGTMFNNNAFDNNCKVNIKYNNSKRFTFFMDANDKVVNIYN